LDGTPSSFFAFWGALAGKNTAPQGLKGKVYCPLAQGWGVAILHNTVIYTRHLTCAQHSIENSTGLI